MGVNCNLEVRTSDGCTCMIALYMMFWRVSFCIPNALILILTIPF